ncbi:MAG: thiamine biosynthesis lipoprotein [Cyclobacteriaceae bacterium]
MNPDFKKRLPRIFFFLAAILLMVKVIRNKDAAIITNEISGQTMGTIPYSIKYKTDGAVDFKDNVDSLLLAFNQSLSTYIPDSEISRFNAYDTLVYENSMFLEVLQASKQVYEKTEAAFDPTVGPLINAWGFGPDQGTGVLSELTVDSLLRFVSFSSINFNTSFAAKPAGVYLDFSAIAKGYAIDLVAGFLESRGVTEYMVEIGGEVAVKGTNSKKETWAIGIEDPLVARDEQKLLAISRVPDRALATSGNYRNYFEQDGKLYAHIIDPRTGYTAADSILSATVFAPTCMIADAYATAFMVMGVQDALTLAESDPTLDALLIYRSGDSVAITMTDPILKQITIMADYK